MTDIKSLIRTIPDFPKKGIEFRDVTTLFLDPKGFHETIKQMADPYREKGIDKVAGIEARGFTLGGAIAYELGLGFVSIRKVGKLPGETVKQSYDLEYGQAEIEVHRDAIQAGDRILLVDDLLATGGTVHAAIKLLECLGANIDSCAFVVDLPDIGGRELLASLGYHYSYLCEFSGH